MSKPETGAVVVYHSVYGSTQRYAQWIAEAVQGKLLNAAQATIGDLEPYDTVVYGGSLHAVGIKGVKLITDNFERLQGKKIIVFCTGASPVRAETTQLVYERNFDARMREKIAFFYLRGAFDYSKLGTVDRMLMYALKLKLQRKKEAELDEDERGLLNSYEHPEDWTDRAALEPIVALVNAD